MYKKLLNLIKYAAVKAIRSDRLAYPTTQVSYMGKLSEAYNLTPYGLYYTLPVNSTCAVFNAVAESENLFAIGNTPTLRFKNLEPGQLVVGSPISKSNTNYDIDGDVSLTVTKDNNVTVTGNTTETTTGALSITGNSSVTITSSGTIIINGNLAQIDSDVIINGNLTVNGTITSAGGSAAISTSGQITALTGTPGEVDFSDIVTKYNVHIHTDAEARPTSIPSNQLP